MKVPRLPLRVVSGQTQAMWQSARVDVCPSEGPRLSLVRTMGECGKWARARISEGRVLRRSSGGGTRRSRQVTTPLVGHPSLFISSATRLLSQGNSTGRTSLCFFEQTTTLIRGYKLQNNPNYVDRTLTSKRLYTERVFPSIYYGPTTRGQRVCKHGQESIDPASLFGSGGTDRRGSAYFPRSALPNGE